MDDLGLGGRRALDGLDPEFLLLHGVLSGREDGVQNILGLGLGHVLLVLLAEPLAGLALLGSGDLGRLGGVPRQCLPIGQWRIVPETGWWGSYQPLLCTVRCPVTNNYLNKL